MKHPKQRYAESQYRRRQYGIFRKYRRIHNNPDIQPRTHDTPCLTQRVTSDHIPERDNSHRRRLFRRYGENSEKDHEPPSGGLSRKNIHNSGSGVSRNIGISIASGEFISFLDSDDVYPDRRSLKRMYDLAHKNGLAICGSLRELKIGWKIIETNDFREECRKSPEGPILEYNPSVTVRA